MVWVRTFYLNLFTKICNEPGKSKQAADHNQLDHNKQKMPEARLNVPWRQ